MATRHEMNSKFRARDFVLRTPSTHAEQLQHLESTDEDYRECSKNYGINYRSVLDELQYFDIATGALIPDVMHDILEGALQYEAKLLLRQFICCDNYFTLDQLNQQIEAFDLGHTEVKDRPSTISAKTISDKDNSLKQSGK